MFKVGLCFTMLGKRERYMESYYESTAGRR